MVRGGRLELDISNPRSIFIEAEEFRSLYPPNCLGKIVHLSDLVDLKGKDVVDGRLVVQVLDITAGDPMHVLVLDRSSLAQDGELMELEVWHDLNQQVQRVCTPGTILVISGLKINVFNDHRYLAVRPYTSFDTVDRIVGDQASQQEVAS